MEHQLKIDIKPAEAFGVCAKCGPTKVHLVRMDKYAAAEPECGTCGGTDIWPKRMIRKRDPRLPQSQETWEL